MLLNSRSSVQSSRVFSSISGARQGRERRLQPGGNVGSRDPLHHLLPGEIVVHAILEGQVDGGEAKERAAAEALDPRHAVEAGLQRNGDQLLHLFGSVPGPLGDDVDLSVHYVRVGLNGELEKAQDTPGKDEGGRAQNQDALMEGEMDDPIAMRSLFSVCRALASAFAASTLSRMARVW